jgi:AraC family L-rhamnose operon regulatory protein RhaS
MPARIPFIYQEGNSHFQIDTCAPQIAAVRGGKIKFHALSNGLYPGLRLKPAQLPGISSLGFWDGVSVQDWGLDAHRNEGVEICFLETGAMAFSLGAKNFELRSGHFTITRPWQLHKLGAPNIGPGRLHWLILDVGVRRPNQEWCWPSWVTLTRADRAQLTRKLRRNENAVWNASPAIAAAFCGLSDCVLKWKQPYAESRTITFLNRLLIEILIALTKQQKHEDPELASRRHTVKLFLHDLSGNDAHIGEVWSLEKMAAHCGMGVTAFSKYCRELVNSGPVEYLNQCRLDRAADQLGKYPSLPVIEIAFRNGFNSSQYFATVFRRRFHTTPRQYRRLSGRAGGQTHQIQGATGSINYARR